VGVDGRGDCVQVGQTCMLINGEQVVAHGDDHSKRRNPNQDWPDGCREIRVFLWLESCRGLDLWLGGEGGGQESTFVSTAPLLQLLLARCKGQGSVHCNKSRRPCAGLYQQPIGTQWRCQRDLACHAFIILMLLASSGSRGWPWLKPK
jgi:hypothetical protein